ncbi:MAG: UDP-N-acetylmuramoyl-L-alanyl-D-glutamate--2,6-diaminopimelate ligase [Bacteroidetes bacterium]|nr:UDP-N-acetylmuramoyl-L-alanyl-D-glutamate--2,6-diaminopimelate ligase [Bacteroidota bacterium]
MILQDLLYKVALQSIHGDTTIEVNQITSDSREVKPGGAFIAIHGHLSDGHIYIGKALISGAKIIVYSNPIEDFKEDVTYIRVKDTSIAFAQMACTFYHHPSEKLKLVGVTGTNGKTTIATMLFHLFTHLGYTCGLISTIQNQIGTQVIPSTHTTPDALHLNALLAKMADAKCSHVFMECSSHAIHQHRIYGLNFTGAIFSNITHDHLDYHKTFHEYIKVKKSFFDNLPPSAFAITNKDDKHGLEMLQNTKAKKYTYSLKTLADFKGKILENNFAGLQMLINQHEVHFMLMGTFNAYNLLAIYGAAICLGEESTQVLLLLSKLKGATGRFDYIISKSKILGVVDYAHTPDALKNILEAIHKINEGKGQIITVVGCGGNRDKTKRPEMARLANDYSTKVILTSDNPRDEDPLQILADMQEGLNTSAKRKTITIADRKEAIKVAVQLAKPADIILIAGKGHETYQEIHGQRSHFNDKEVLNEMFDLMHV